MSPGWFIPSTTHIAAVTRLRCVSMQPFGGPVVPDV